MKIWPSASGRKPRRESRKEREKTEQEKYTEGETGQLQLDGVIGGAGAMKEFVPIVYGQTEREIVEGWNYGGDPELQNSILKLYYEVKDHADILCSISGGYDSDIMLDMIERFGGHGKTTYIFQNTGLEYEATKRHLKEIEERYGIKVTELKPKMAIPVCVKKFGVPFWGKYVSQMLQRLQKHNFQWEDESFEVLYKRYPRNKSSLRFWCNDFKTKNGQISKFNIEYVRGLKEFIMSSPPDFRISPKCCDYAKKDPAHDFLNAGSFDMNCVGVRKAERGVRATAYTSCFDRGFCGADQFRPLFWITDAQKDAYRKQFGIVRSDCYEVRGMERTGCACCPFGKQFEEELELVQKYEPKLFNAVQAIFGKSYDHTRRFLEFRKTLPKEAKEEGAGKDG